MLQEVRFNFCWVGFVSIHFIDGDDNRRFCGLRIFYRLNCLWHNPIISGHNEDHNINRFGAARAHFRKGCMARRIQNRDLLP